MRTPPAQLDVSFSPWCHISMTCISALLSSCALHLQRHFRCEKDYGTDVYQKACTHMPATAVLAKTYTSPKTKSAPKFHVWEVRTILEGLLQCERKTVKLLPNCIAGNRHVGLSGFVLIVPMFLHKLKQLMLTATARENLHNGL